MKRAAPYTKTQIIQQMASRPGAVYSFGKRGRQQERFLEGFGRQLSSKMSVSPRRRAIFQNSMMFQAKPRGACGAVHKDADYSKNGFSPRRRAQFWQARVATRALSWGFWAPAELENERLAEAPCYFL